jgi:hypothetical protein
MGNEKKSMKEVVEAKVKTYKEKVEEQVEPRCLRG